MPSQKLVSYLSGRWSSGEGIETHLADPVSGEELATAAANGVDRAGALSVSLYGEEHGFLGRRVSRIGPTMGGFWSSIPRSPALIPATELSCRNAIMENLAGPAMARNSAV
jgi:hypothetical protein